MNLPDFQKLANRFPAALFDKFPVSRKTLKYYRLLMSLPSGPPQSNKDIVVSNQTIPGLDGQQNLRLRIYRPKSPSSGTPALVWFHGGGYVIGKPENDDDRCIRYAREAGLIVISVDYHLAPEHPFPAGLMDGYMALRWVLANSSRIGVDQNRIAVGGQSAGGGLAAALTQYARNMQEVRIIFQLLVYPMLDDRSVNRPGLNEMKFPVWGLESNRFGWESYLEKGGGAEVVPQYAVPARCTNFSGLPDAWIGVGTADLFHDEALAYARNLVESGGNCEVNTVPGAFHGFDVFAPQHPVVRDFMNSQVVALRHALFQVHL